MTDFAIIGFGSRGTLFAGYIKENANMRLTAVVTSARNNSFWRKRNTG